VAQGTSIPLIKRMLAVQYASDRSAELFKHMKEVGRLVAHNTRA